MQLGWFLNHDSCAAEFFSLCRHIVCCNCVLPQSALGCCSAAVLYGDACLTWMQITSVVNCSLAGARLWLHTALQLPAAASKPQVGLKSCCCGHLCLGHSVMALRLACSATPTALLAVRYHCLIKLVLKAVKPSAAVVMTACIAAVGVSLPGIWGCACRDSVQLQTCKLLPQRRWPLTMSSKQPVHV